LKSDFAENAVALIESLLQQEKNRLLGRRDESVGALIGKRRLTIPFKIKPLSPFNHNVKKQTGRGLKKPLSRW
jgi:hypothetical protein